MGRVVAMIFIQGALMAISLALWPVKVEPISISSACSLQLGAPTVIAVLHV